MGLYFLRIFSLVFILHLLFGRCVFPCRLPFETYTTADGLPQSTVNSIIQDKKGYIWFATWGGATRYDGKNFAYYTIEDGLANNGVLSMMEDREGNLWFATFNGVSKLTGDSLISFTTKDGLIDNHVRAVQEDSL